MRGQEHLRRIAASVVPLVAALAGLAPAASGSPPAPCLGQPQITDVVHDGHHPGTDLIAAWLTESAGRLQAVLQTQDGVWRPEHEDEPITGSEYALVFDAGGTTWYVRLAAPLVADGPQVADWGTYAAGMFTRLGSTTVTELVSGPFGTAVVDVPADVTGSTTPGSRLTNLFALTLDGRSALGIPHWVDHAPGGTAVDDATRGADFVVGACAAAGGGDGGGGAAGGVAQTTLAVQLRVPARATGATSPLASGQVVPARGGVPVEIEVDPVAGGAGTRTLVVQTAADGTYATRFRLLETSIVRATAEGVRSQGTIVRVQARVTARLLASDGTGGVAVAAEVEPALPGRLLLLATDSVDPIATAVVRTRAGRRTIVLRPRLAPPGRYQVVYIPAASRADRATSKVVRIR